MSEILVIDGLVKHFSGLLATDHVSLSLPTGELHALIGPNGAGKTTLVNQLCGELQPDAGRVYFRGEDVTSTLPHERAKRGMGRTFQISSLPNEFSVHRCIALAVSVRMSHGSKLFDSFADRGPVWEEADEMLAASLLKARRNVTAGELSAGERKQLELLMALAGKPSLLLLDEPMAGLGKSESIEMVEVLQSLRGQITMLLIEHDMDAVFALADKISVLVSGRILITGSIAEIKNNDDVKLAYLGGEDELC